LVDRYPPGARAGRGWKRDDDDDDDDDADDDDDDGGGGGRNQSLVSIDWPVLAANWSTVIPRAMELDRAYWLSLRPRVFGLQMWGWVVVMMLMIMMVVIVVMMMMMISLPTGRPGDDDDDDDDDDDGGDDDNGSVTGIWPGGTRSLGRTWRM
jgi:hypothetical protein